jgi:DNA invertase Pin-like site-specific DNA recombinase
MLKDTQRRSFDVVMAWAIDRPGRSLIAGMGIIKVAREVGVVAPCSVWMRCAALSSP